MKPSELLREARDRVTKPGAWLRGSRVQIDGPGCVVDHLRDAATDAHPRAVTNWLDRDDGYRALKALHYAANERNWSSAQGLNDHNPTRLWGVVAMLGRAIRRLESEGK